MAFSDQKRNRFSSLNHQEWWVLSASTGDSTQSSIKVPIKWAPAVEKNAILLHLLVFLHLYLWIYARIPQQQSRYSLSHFTKARAETRMKFRQNAHFTCNKFMSITPASLTAYTYRRFLQSRADDNVTHFDIHICECLEWERTAFDFHRTRSRCLWKRKFAKSNACV